MRRKWLVAAGVLVPAHCAVAQLGTPPGSELPWVVSTAFVDMSSCDKPKYPEASLAAKESGTTRLRYVADIDRSIRDVRIERSSGWPSLDQAAVDAFGRCKAVPAFVNGAPVQSFGRISFNWRPGTQAAVDIGSARCQPSYPEEAVRLELQGTSKLRLSVNESGALDKIEIVKSSGSGLLDAAAISGLATCRFKVGQDANGKPIASSFEVEYVWKLEQ